MLGICPSLWTYFQTEPLPWGAIGAALPERSGPPFFMALHPQESSLAPPVIEGAPGLAVFETWNALLFP
jgi:hypothetical protein